MNLLSCICKLMKSGLAKIIDTIIDHFYAFVFIVMKSDTYIYFLVWTYIYIFSSEWWLKMHNW